MDRTLILGAAFSAALHAGLLLGPERGAVPPRVIDRPNILLKPIEMPPQEPEPEDAPPSEEKSAEPAKSPVPRSADPITTPAPDDFVMKPVPAVEVDVRVSDLKEVDFNTNNLATKAQGMLRFGDLDNVPRARVQIAPPYPHEARSQGVDGTVLVEFIVDETGRVIEPRIVSSSNRVFDDTTLRTMTRWRFEPGRKNGRAVRFRMALPLDFKLNND